MARHGHDQSVERHRDRWARQHHEVGEAREPELGKATDTLLQVAQVGRDSRVLDVACGAGDTTAAATRAGANATGIDSSADMIRIARDRFPGTSFMEGDMTAPPHGPWDAIVCRLGAHHADVSWLSAAWAVLRSGGRLAIAERDATEAEDRANGMKRVDEWVRLLQAAGFEEVQVVASEARFPGPIYIIAGTRPSVPGE